MQSSASAAIARLERELGTALFDRVGRRIEITEAGQSLLAHARFMLASSRAAREDLKGLREGLRGAVTLGAVPATGTLDLPDAMNRFRRVSPDVHVKLRLSPESVEIQVEALIEGRLDLLLVPMQERHETGICLRPVAQCRIVPVVGLNHPLASASAISFSDLAAHEQIDFPVGWSDRDIADRAFASSGVARSVGIEVVDVTTALRLAAGGAGIAFVDEQFTAGRAELTTLDLESCIPPIGLALGWTTLRSLSLPVSRLRDALLAAAQTGDLRRGEPADASDAPRSEVAKLNLLSR